MLVRKVYSYERADGEVVVNFEINSDHLRLYSIWFRKNRVRGRGKFKRIGEQLTYPSQSDCDFQIAHKGFLRRQDRAIARELRALR